MSPGMDNEGFRDEPVTNGNGVHHDDHLMDDEDNHVVIIGAGPAGLMLA
jgi:ribulose 1,5-bisphosphate synthetase/thiazole synthase